MRVTHMHGSSVHKMLFACACRHLSLTHLLPSHVSPVLAPAVPWQPPRYHSWLWRPRLPAELSRPESAGQAHSARGRAVLATWPSSFLPQVMSPRSSTRSLPWMMTRPSSTMRTTMSPTSRKPRTGTLVNLVFTQCLNPLFCTFLIGDFVPLRESKESMQSGNRCNRERDEREGFVISVADGTVLGACSSDSQRILFWWMRSPRTSSTKSSTSCSWWKFMSEKILLDWVRHGDPKFGTKKFRIRSIRVATRAWISKTTIIWMPINGQIKFNVREYICVANWRWKSSSSGTLRKKLPRIWRMEKTLQPRGKYFKITKIGRNSCATWSGITYSGSIGRSSTKIARTIGISFRFENLLRSWLTEQLWQCLRSSSSSSYFEFKKT